MKALSDRATATACLTGPALSARSSALRLAPRAAEESRIFAISVRQITSCPPFPFRFKDLDYNYLVNIFRLPFDNTLITRMPTITHP